MDTNDAFVKHYCGVKSLSRKVSRNQRQKILVSSYNQRRTVMLNYEVLANIYKSRKNHKLDEWCIFCDWIKKLPYSEIITGKSEMNDQEEENEQNK